MVMTPRLEFGSFEIKSIVMLNRNFTNQNCKKHPEMFNSAAILDIFLGKIMP